MNHLNSWPLFPALVPSETAGPLSLQFLIQQWQSAVSWLKETQATEEDPLDRLEQWLSFSLPGPLAYKGGVLDRLCFYAHILLEASHFDKEHKLLVHLEGMKQDARHLNSYLSLAKKSRLASGEQAFAPEYLMQEKWEEWLEISQRKIKELFDLFFNFLQEFKQDENLLFLLIEQKEALNQYLGQRAVESILSRLFPQGACALREAIYNGYARRGFLDFYARNEELIESVDWKDPCPPSNLKLES